MNQKFYEMASSEVGVSEVRGGECARILEYHMATKLKATEDEVPWCSAFACWVVERAGVISPRSAWARDWLKWGKPLEKPELGCICVFTRNETSGHVGFYHSENDNSVFVLGGNQDNQVKVKPYPKANLLGYRSAP